MTKPITLMLQFVGLILIFSGWASASIIVVGVGMATAIIGGLNYLRLAKAEQQDK